MLKPKDSRWSLYLVINFIHAILLFPSKTTYLFVSSINGDTVISSLGFNPSDALLHKRIWHYLGLKINYQLEFTYNHIQPSFALYTPKLN